jgi:hypothetical protein
MNQSVAHRVPFSIFLSSWWQVAIDSSSDGSDAAPIKASTASADHGSPCMVIHTAWSAMDLLYCVPYSCTNVHVQAGQKHLPDFDGSHSARRINRCPGVLHPSSTFRFETATLLVASSDRGSEPLAVSEGYRQQSHGSVQEYHEKPTSISWPLTFVALENCSASANLHNIYNGDRRSGDTRGRCVTCCNEVQPRNMDGVA